MWEKKSDYHRSARRAEKSQTLHNPRDHAPMKTIEGERKLRGRGNPYDLRDIREADCKKLLLRVLRQTRLWVRAASRLKYRIA